MSDAIKQDIKLFGDSSDLSLIGNRLKAPPLPASECDHGTNVETTGASIVYSAQWVRPPCTPASPCPPLHQLPNSNDYFLHRFLMMRGFYNLN